MPSGRAAAMREAVRTENRENLELERTPWNNTGFVNVIKVKNKFQARLQVPGDGRGGSTKRKQHSLPGLFDTAEEAAVMLAIIKREMKASTGGKLFAPPKINKPHKPRTRPAVANPASPMHACAAAAAASGHCSGFARGISAAKSAVGARLTASDAALGRCDDVTHGV